MDAAPEVLVPIQRKTATALTRIKVGETGRHTFLPTLFCTEQYFSDAFCVCSCLYLRIHNAVNNDWVLRYVFSDNGMRIGEEFQAEIPSYNPGRLLPLFLCYWICFSFCIFSSFLSIYYFILFYCFYLFVLFWFWLFQMVDYGKMLSVWTEQLNLAKNMP